MELRTLCDIFYHSVETHRKPDHLRYKKDGAWRDISSEEFRRAVEELSMGLRALGIDRGDRVAILSENRPEWAYADLATCCAAAVDVPIYPSLTPPQMLYILNDSQSKAIFVSNEPLAAKVAEIRAQAPALKHVIRMDDGGGRGHAHPVRGAGPRPQGARGGSRRGEGPCRGGEARRPGHHHLYVGDDRRAQGGDAHPRQHRVQRGRQRPHRLATSGPTTSRCPSSPCATSSSAWAAST